MFSKPWGVGADQYVSDDSSEVSDHHLPSII